MIIKLHRRLFPANISCFPRRLQDVFSVTLFVFQDLFKTSSRRLQDVFAIRLPEMSSRRLQDVFKTCLQDVLQLCLQDVFKTSWKTKKCYTEDVFSTSSPRQMFAGFIGASISWYNFRNMRQLFK